MFLNLIFGEIPSLEFETLGIMELIFFYFLISFFLFEIGHYYSKKDL